MSPRRDGEEKRYVILSQLVTSYRTECTIILQGFKCNIVHLIFAQIESIVDEIICIMHSHRSRLAESSRSFFHL